MRVLLTKGRSNLWKLTKPRFTQIDEGLFATGYLDGGSIEVQFRVGEQVHILWAKRPRRRSRGYDYWYTEYVILNGWLLDRQTERLDELRQAILDFLSLLHESERRVWKTVFR